MSETELPKKGRRKPKLEEAANDWLPEGSAVEREATGGTVTLVSDPFGIPTLDIAEKQDSNEELDLDEDFADEAGEGAEAADAESEEEDEEGGDDASPTDAENEDEESTGLEPGVEPQSEEMVEYDMAKLARAMREEQDRQIETLEGTVNAEAEADAEAEARNAQQIAEDLALEAAEKARAEEEAEDEVDPELAAALPSQPVADESGALDLSELQSCIETLLFMSDKPMKTEKLQELLGPEIPFNLFQEAVTGLKDRYQAVHHGFELVDVGGGLQFRTKPGRAALARKLAKVQVQRLSGGAMETLAIVAFKQPVLKDDIDQIRGVDSSHFIRTLMDRKLIQISGRSELPGRPMLYTTTTEFLELFGLNSLEDMPSLHELEQMVPSSETRGREDEDPRVVQMRKLVQEMKENSQSILDYDPREDEQILKDIRERVQSIPSSTPYLDEQKALEKAEKAEQNAKLEALRSGKTPLTEEALAEGATAELPLEGQPAADGETPVAAVFTPAEPVPAEERINAD
jgi:segregation and condensation protein B